MLNKIKCPWFDFHFYRTHQVQAIFRYLSHCTFLFKRSVHICNTYVGNLVYTHTARGYFLTKLFIISFYTFPAVSNFPVFCEGRSKDAYMSRLQEWFKHSWRWPSLSLQLGMFVVGLKSPSTSCHMLLVLVKYLNGMMSRQSTAYVRGQWVLYYSFLAGT